jgi:hypothetical protein
MTKKTLVGSYFGMGLYHKLQESTVVVAEANLQNDSVAGSPAAKTPPAT